MKRGFSMVELVFVIVILGILAAIAIPRFTATRDDAKASALVNNLAQCVTDVASAYTALGQIDDINKSRSCIDAQKDSCFKLTVSDSNLTVTDNNTSGYCAVAQNLAHDKNLSSATGVTFTFGGSGVQY